MGVERYVVEAVVLGGMSHREAARRAGVSKAWVTKLMARYRSGGVAALEPRSRRPRSCAHAAGPEVQAAVVQLRGELEAAGHDSGPHTIAHHLRLQRAAAPSVATIWRILKRHGLITAQPQKRPKASFIRFEAQLPNELWQADTTHWHLADGRDVEILNCVDDHSRLLVVSDAFSTVKAADVVHSFAAAWLVNGFPAAVLTDNGAVFSGKSRQGKVLLESELERHGIAGKHSKAYHPQTCGKVERLHQTLKRYLSKQTPPRSLAVLQAQLDTFRTYYNQLRPHRALHGATPLQAYHARIKAGPRPASAPAHFRVRHDRVDKCGRVTLRYLSRLYHIGLGARYKQQHVTLLVANKDIRVLAHDGTLIRALTLDPTRDYQPQDTPLIGHHVLRQVGTIT